MMKLGWRRVRRFERVETRSWRFLLFVQLEQSLLGHGRPLSISSVLHSFVNALTGTSLDFTDPSILLVLVLTILTPSPDPCLLVIVPNLPILLAMTDTLLLGESLPFRRWFGLGQRFLSGKRGCRVG
jgi:hypothetical protein